MPLERYSTSEDDSEVLPHHSRQGYNALSKVQELLRLSLFWYSTDLLKQGGCRFAKKHMHPCLSQVTGWLLSPLSGWLLGTHLYIWCGQESRTHCANSWQISLTHQILHDLVHETCLGDTEMKKGQTYRHTYRQGRTRWTVLILMEQQQHHTGARNIRLFYIQHRGKG